MHPQVPQNGDGVQREPREEGSYQQVPQNEDGVQREPREEGSYQQVPQNEDGVQREPREEGSYQQVPQNGRCVQHEVHEEDMSILKDMPKEDKRSQDPTLPTPPDGGWGWMVVFASFMIHVIADGIAYSFGVYVDSFVEFFDCNKSEFGWLGSLMIGVTWGSGKSLELLVVVISDWRYIG